jgi:sulfate transport system permease protein
LRARCSGHLVLRVLALAYLSALLIAPLALVFARTLQDGVSIAWAWMSTPAAVSALALTLMIAAIAVPVNTIFGIGAALLLERRRGALIRVLDAVIDLPFVVSPVLVGFALLLVYGRGGLLGDAALAHGIRIAYAVPGMVIATLFVSLPFVVREVAPVLRHTAHEPEQAAATLGAGPWQILRHITIPAIRWGVAYGIVLASARALGEIGAVLLVSSNVAGATLTLPLLVYQRDGQAGAQATVGVYAAASELTLISLAVLLLMNMLGARAESER